MVLKEDVILCSFSPRPEVYATSVLARERVTRLKPFSAVAARQGAASSLLALTPAAAAAAARRPVLPEGEQGLWLLLVTALAGPNH